MGCAGWRAGWLAGLACVLAGCPFLAAHPATVLLSNSPCCNLCWLAHAASCCCTRISGWMFCHALAAAPAASIRQAAWGRTPAHHLQRSRAGCALSLPATVGWPGSVAKQLGAGAASCGKLLTSPALPLPPSMPAAVEYCRQYKAGLMGPTRCYCVYSQLVLRNAAHAAD